MTDFYYAFISYCHADEHWAAWLQNALERFRVPGRLRVENPNLPVRLSPVFRDKEELASSADLGDSIRTALSCSNALIVVCSPAAAASRWVNEEIRTFRQLAPNGKILCLLVAGSPESQAEDCAFPPALLIDAAGHRQPEPLAADPRPGADGKRGTLLKMAAGLLGVGIDDLKQRDQQRRTRFLTALAGGALAVAAVTVGLAIIAYVARQEADDRRDQAENLIGFMLGDLRDKLETVGRLDIMDDVGDRAVAYFSAVPAEDLTEEELFRRAQAFNLIGRVRMDQGRLESATEAFERYRDLAASLVSNDPDNSEWVLSAGIAEFWLGEVLRKQGNLDGALEHYESYLDVAERLYEQDPTNTKLKLERGDAHYNVGIVLESKGELEAALAEYEMTLAMEQELVKQGSTVNLDVKLGLARSHDRVGVLNEKLGRLESARRHYLENLEICEELVDLEPDNATWLNFKAIAHNHLAQIFQILGRLGETLAQYREDLDLREQLSGQDPMNKDWARELAVTQRHLGLALLESGDSARASDLIRASVTGLDGLVDDDPTNRGWKTHLAWSQIAMGKALLASGRHSEALERAATAISGNQPITKSEPTLQVAVRLLADAYLLQGRAYLGAGEREAATQSWKRGVDVIEPVTRANKDTRFIAILAQLLIYLEDPRAEREVQALAERGYRKRDFVALCERKGIVLVGAE